MPTDEALKTSALVIQVVSAAIAFAGTLIAANAARRAIAAGQEQSRSAKRQRWLEDFVSLCRDPVLERLKAMSEDIAALVDHAAARIKLELPIDPSRVIGETVEQVQDAFLRARTDLSVTAVAADEVSLWDRLVPLLEQAEDDVLELVASSNLVNMRPEARRNTLHHSFSRIRRAVAQYGKDGPPRKPSILPRI